MVCIYDGSPNEKQISILISQQGSYLFSESYNSLLFIFAKLFKNDHILNAICKETPFFVPN